MKNVIGFIVVCLVGRGVAQSVCDPVVSAIPSCAVSSPPSYKSNLHQTNTSQSSCIVSAADAVGCQKTDLACACSSSANSAIVNSAIGCVIQACGTQTAIRVSLSALDVCSCASAHPVAAVTTATIKTTTTVPAGAIHTVSPGSSSPRTVAASKTGSSNSTNTGVPFMGGVDGVQVWVKTEVMVVFIVGAVNAWL